MTAAEKLIELQAERVELAATRTREDVKAICERSLANAYARLNGAMPSRYFLNETALPEHLLAVIAEFEVETKRRCSSTLSRRTRRRTRFRTGRRSNGSPSWTRRSRKAEQEAREAAKAEALAAIEERFGGVAA
jgi:hypothetical protein